VEKTITIEREVCPEYVYFPNAFTPNNDGLNETFKPGLGGRLQSYRLTIYNRYGQVVFTSNDPYAGWDGKFKTLSQQNGVYVFFAQYNFFNQPIKSVKGTITLIR
jgi:gliding motility-associated-like protein